jgi:hypothetical protein
MLFGSSNTPLPACQQGPTLDVLQGVTRILHCGDMRWQPAMVQHPALIEQPLDVLYLDTTYAAPRHLHPPQVLPSAICSCLIRQITS